MIFVYIINIYTFLSTIGQTYILKHDTVPELHSFGDGGTIYAVFSLPQQLILAR
jgi:hypothetical protein